MLATDREVVVVAPHMARDKQQGSPKLEGLPEHEDIVVIAMEEVGRAWRGRETGGEAWSVVVKQNGAEHKVYIVREQ
jgi:hypothetical protein